MYFIGLSRFIKVILLGFVGFKRWTCPDLRFMQALGQFIVISAGLSSSGFFNLFKRTAVAKHINIIVFLWFYRSGCHISTNNLWLHKFSRTLSSIFIQIKAKHIWRCISHIRNLFDVLSLFLILEPHNILLNVWVIACKTNVGTGLVRVCANQWDISFVITTCMLASAHRRLKPNLSQHIFQFSRWLNSKLLFWCSHTLIGFFANQRWSHPLHIHRFYCSVIQIIIFVCLVIKIFLILWRLIVSTCCRFRHLLSANIQAISRLSCTVRVSLGSAGIIIVGDLGRCINICSSCIFFSIWTNCTWYLIVSAILVCIWWLLVLSNCRCSFLLCRTSSFAGV